VFFVKAAVVHCNKKPEPRRCLGRASLSGEADVGGDTPGGDPVRTTGADSTRDRIEGFLAKKVLLNNTIYARDLQ
jgi:hypothetical protein